MRRSAGRRDPAASAHYGAAGSLRARRTRATRGLQRPHFAPAAAATPVATNPSAHTRSSQPRAQGRSRRRAAHQPVSLFSGDTRLLSLRQYSCDGLGGRGSSRRRGRLLAGIAPRARSDVPIGDRRTQRARAPRGSELGHGQRRLRAPARRSVCRSRTSAHHQFAGTSVLVRTWRGGDSISIGRDPVDFDRADAKRWKRRLGLLRPADLHGPTAVGSQ